MIITKNIKMADLIHENYLLLPVINRFGIQLGFGDKNIKEVCENNNVNVDFFLEIVNAFNNKNYFPEKHLQSFSMLEIVDYLKKTHDYFINFKILVLENKIETLVKNCFSEKKEKFAIVENFYKEYKKELTEHIEFEDKTIYPYVLKIEEIFKSEEKDLEPLEKFGNYTIKKYQGEHSDVEEKLFDLKNLIIKYLPPQKNNNLSNSILYEMFELGKDLNDHQQIEDKVLIPKVVQMESLLGII